MGKTNFITTCIAVLLLALQVGCGNGTTSTTGYYQNNGMCYSSTNGQTVPMNYCMSMSGYTGMSGTNGYYQSNGLCYSSNGQSVPMNYCATSGMNGYYMNNGYCYSQAGQMVNNTYCSNNMTGTAGATSCMGTYYQYVGSSYQTINCNGSNCHGLTLYNSAGSQVYCQ